MLLSHGESMRLKNLTSRLAEVAIAEHNSYWRGTAIELLEAAEDVAVRFDSTQASERALPLGFGARETVERLAATVRACDQEVQRNQQATLLPVKERSDILNLSERVGLLCSMARDLSYMQADYTNTAKFSYEDRPFSQCNRLIKNFVSRLTAEGKLAKIGGPGESILVGWRWSHRYIFYPKSNIAYLPMSDVARSRLWPILVHEVAHSRFQPGESYYDVCTSIRQSLHELYAKLGWDSNYEEMVKPRIDHQICEILADVYASRVMGLSYLLAFLTHVGDDSDQDRVTSSDFAVKWAFNRSNRFHPPAVLRYLLIAKVIEESGLVDFKSVPFCEHLLQSQVVVTTSFGQKLFNECVQCVSRLIGEAMRQVDPVLEDLSITEDIYIDAESALEKSMDNLSSEKIDFRTICLASTLKRISSKTGWPSGASVLASLGSIGARFA